MFSDDAKLGEVRAFVLDARQKSDGVDCPCCTRHCKEHEYSLSRRLCEELLTLYRAKTPLHKSEFITGDAGGWNTNVLKHFGLIKQWGEDESKPYKRSGVYAITAIAVQWIEGLTLIPQFVYVFDNEVIRVSDKKWRFIDAMGSDWRPGMNHQESRSEAA